MYWCGLPWTIQSVQHPLTITIPIMSLPHAKYTHLRLQELRSHFIKTQAPSLRSHPLTQAQVQRKRLWWGFLQFLESRSFRSEDLWTNKTSYLPTPPPQPQHTTVDSQWGTYRSLVFRKGWKVKHGGVTSSRNPETLPGVWCSSLIRTHSYHLEMIVHDFWLPLQSFFLFHKKWPIFWSIFPSLISAWSH